MKIVIFMNCDLPELEIPYSYKETYCDYVSFCFFCLCFRVPVVLKVQKQPPEVFCKSGVPRNFAIFTRKHLCWSLFLIKFSRSGLQLYLKKAPIQVFPVSISKFVRTPILKNICERLLL